ncbi:MAG: hypothetical protein FJX74_22280 [Armatimonadetes bacterium]|nr:hypothetical protein [Armatimonadota bacterium]
MPRSDSRPEPRTTVIGWQGYTVSVPEDWTIGAIGGDRMEGYLRIDGTDMPRMEIKWFDRKGPVGIEEVVGNYLRDLHRKRRRRDPEVTTKRDTRLLGRRKGGRRQLESFHWTDGDRQAHGAAWQCAHCERVSIVQVLGRADEGLEEEARELLLAVADHPEDGWVTWATYGLQCEIPEEFVLDGQKLMAGLIDLNFKLETEQIAVMRWGMADVALGDKDLKTWAQKELAGRLKSWECTFEELEFNGHPAIAITGEPALFQARVRRFVLHCLRRPYGSNVRSLIWHCQPGKKLYAVECIVDDSRLELPAEICQRLICHS